MDALELLINRRSASRLAETGACRRAITEHSAGRNASSRS